MAHHEGAGIVACRSTAGGASAGPLTAFIARRQQFHRLVEIFFYLVEYGIVGAVAPIESVQRRVGSVICDEGRVLIITYQIVV